MVIYNKININNFKEVIDYINKRNGRAKIKKIGTPCVTPETRLMIFTYQTRMSLRSPVPSDYVEDNSITLSFYKNKTIIENVVFIIPNAYDNFKKLYDYYKSNYETTYCDM